MRKLIALLAVGALVSATNAAYTSVAANPGEPGIFQTLENVYGGTAAGSITGTINLTSGYTLTRVHDTGAASPIHLLLGNPATNTDQVWTDGLTRFVGRARHAAYSQTFGADLNNNGVVEASDQPLITIPSPTQIDYPVGMPGAPTTTFTFAANSTWSWYRSGGAAADVFSNEALNIDPNTGQAGYDHMIAFELTGPTTLLKSWVLFWDDETMAATDRDFNDLMIELSVVPAPGAGLLGLIGCALITVFRRRTS